MRARLLAFAICAVLVAPAEAKSPPLPAGAPAHWLQKPACPFECCRYGRWTAVVILLLRDGASDSAKEITTISAGTSFRALTGHTETDAGVARFLQADQGFGKGQTVAIYDHIGEGHYRAWVTDHMRDVDLAELQVARIEKPPAQVWWVEAQLEDGQKGWIRMPSMRAVIGQDSCAGPIR